MPDDAIDQLFDRNPPVDGAHVFIQYKGTDLCADVTCACGQSGHLDAMFVYYVRCSACGTLYMLPHTLALIDVPEHLRASVEPSVIHDIRD